MNQYVASHDQRPRTHESHPRKLGDPGLKICTGCRAIYQRKAWQHDTEQFRSYRISQGIVARHVLCPACKMISAHQYEGKVVIEDIPSYFSSELINLILSYGRKARWKDPEDRLIEVRKSDHGIELTTTEDQLAVRLAKKVREVFKRVRLNIHYGKSSSGATTVWLKFIGHDQQLSTR